MPRDLRAAAEQALSRPRFRRLLELVPANERSSPRALLGWLTSAAELDRKSGDSAEFATAYAALSDLAAAEDLQNRVATLYHSGTLRAQANEAGLDFERLYNNPEEAYSLLVSRSAAGRLSKEFDEALSVLGEVREFARENGAPLQPAAATPIPAGQAAP